LAAEGETVIMRRLALLVALLLLPLASPAHVNSPDVYYDGYAGPYHLLVTIKPPAVVPGIAEIQIRSESGDVQTIRVVPLKMIGVAAKLAPTPDVAERSQQDPQLFYGKLWIMNRGSWKVQIDAQGSKGTAQLFVPLPAVSTKSAGMQKALGGLLAILGLVLVAGVVGIVGAAAREASLPASEQPTSEQSKRGYRREAIAAVLVVAALVLGDRWWRAEAATNARLNYKLPQLTTELLAGNTLRLTLENPNVVEIDRFGVKQADEFKLDDLVPDHGHVMHLFLVRSPDMESFWHLHPDQIGEGRFALNLPAMPAGHYKIFADIVHRTGFPETQVGDIDLPVLKGAAVSGDDAGGPELSASSNVSELGDGYRMVWERGTVPLKANEPLWFRFHVEDKDGHPATDMQDYMGMAGHAVFMSSDGRVFAHVHPAGSVPMASAMIASGGEHDMNSMQHDDSKAEVAFPYGFPQAGEYRIFVQVKRAGRVETGVFLAQIR
jgi:hypothetical protein